MTSARNLLPSRSSPRPPATTGARRSAGSRNPRESPAPAPPAASYAVAVRAAAPVTGGTPGAVDRATERLLSWPFALVHAFRRRSARRDLGAPCAAHGRERRAAGRLARAHRPRPRRPPRRLDRLSTATAAGSCSRSCSRRSPSSGHAILFRAVSVERRRHPHRPAREHRDHARRPRRDAAVRERRRRRHRAHGVGAASKSGMEARDVAARMTTFMVLLYSVYMGALLFGGARPLHRHHPRRRLVRDDDRPRDLRRAS